MSTRIRLAVRSIPPHTALKRVAPRLHPHEQRGWRPHVVRTTADRRRAPSGNLLLLIRARIDALTAEIEQWLPEFGEDALLALYEERARWGELWEQHIQPRSGGNSRPTGPSPAAR